MEIQDRAVLATRSLSVRAFALPAATAVVLVVAAVVLAAQPLRAPWWTYADADATYTGAALNLVAGERALFVDHPGLPVTEIAAVVLGMDALADGSFSTSERRTWADRMLLGLDATRGAFRGIAVVFYLAGALASVLFAAWFFEDWLAGLAGGLLWVGAPGLMPMSIQLRPDVLLGVCCVVFAYLVAAAAERRSAGLYAAAAGVAGFALTVKLHGVGLAVPLAVAVAWRPPPRAWRPGRRSLVAGAVLAVVALVANVERFPYTPTAAQTAAGATTIAVLAAAVVAARARGRLGGIAGVVAAYVGGVMVPVLLAIPDGLQALVLLARAALGRGVSDVPTFQTPLFDGLRLGGAVPVLVLGLALAASVLAARRREPAPVLWAAGAAALLVLAWARPVASHYLAPAYLLAVPAILWLARAMPRRLALLALPLALLAAWPAVRDRSSPADNATSLRATGEAARAAAVAGLAADQVAVAPSYFPDPDVRYFELVQLYVARTPDYPYRVIPATTAAASFARERGLRPGASIQGAELP
ncbi:MAG TPA: hypothetical protein VE444_06640 [Gaiellaceae bacterium]|nr:hypothetical protein [Gaiellaceae bacterium]